MNHIKNFKSFKISENYSISKYYTDKQIDDILDKINISGIDSLDDSEKKILNIIKSGDNQHLNHLIEHYNHILEEIERKEKLIVEYPNQLRYQLRLKDELQNLIDEKDRIKNMIFNNYGVIL